LIQSAVPGFARPWRWSGGTAPLPPGLDQALAWLQHFQACRLPHAPWPAITLGQLAETVLAHRARHLAAHPQWASLLAAIPESLLVPPPDVADQPAAPVHGDFWAGNILFSGSRRAPVVAVIDWSGFAPGTRFHDILTLFANLPCATTRARSWQVVFFTPGRARQALARWAQRLGATPAYARWAFYLFAQQRMAWELGLDLQTRSPAERAQAELHWRALTALLAASSFPSPL